MDENLFGVDEEDKFVNLLLAVEKQKRPTRTSLDFLLRILVALSLSGTSQLDFYSVFFRLVDRVPEYELVILQELNKASRFLFLFSLCFSVFPPCSLLFSRWSNSTLASRCIAMSATGFCARCTWWWPTRRVLRSERSSLSCAVPWPLSVCLRVRFGSYSASFSRRRRTRARHAGPLCCASFKSRPRCRPGRQCRTMITLDWALVSPCLRLLNCPRREWRLQRGCASSRFSIRRSKTRRASCTSQWWWRSAMKKTLASRVALFPTFWWCRRRALASVPCRIR